jgi:Predicted pPIWI-associating nuclease
MNSLLDANRHLTQVVEQIGLPESSVAAAFSGPEGVHEILRGAGLSTTLTASFLQMDMSRMLSASLVAQQRLAVLDRVPLGSLVGADATFRRSVAAHLGRLTRSYERLLAGAAQPSLVARLPLIAAYAPVEYFRHVQTLESVSIVAVDGDDALVTVDASLDDAVPGIDDLLREFDGSLCPLLVGARQALAGRNPDRARHVTTSLRELFTQVLHSLAPDDGVRSWTSQADHFIDKRPTRRARLRNVSTRMRRSSLVFSEQPPLCRAC